MERSTVTTKAKSMGAKIIFRKGAVTCYKFKNEDDLLNFRGKIPFTNLWTHDNQLNVYFDDLKDW
jgi:hypothetical protein